MTKQFRVLLMVCFALFALCGTVSAYSEEAEKEVTVVTSSAQKTYTTTAQTVEEFLEETGIEYRNEDELSLDLSDPLKDNTTLTITKATAVVLEADGAPRRIYTTCKTVGEFLEENEDSLPEEYELQEVTPDTKLKENMTIAVTSTKQTGSTWIEEIPYESVEVENDTLEQGVRRVKQEGENGQLQITETTQYEGGKLVHTDSQQQVLAEPVDEVIEIGTMVPPAPVEEEPAVATIDGYAYRSSLTVQATGYSPYDAGCTGITATGIAAGRGVIAVDPSVIPLGTALYIPGYGYGIAADTGGAIRGNRIDLCYDSRSEALTWGRQSVTVYILN